MSFSKDSFLRTVLKIDVNCGESLLHMCCTPFHKAKKVPATLPFIKLGFKRLKIFDGLFRRRIESAGDVAGPEYFGHYKDPLKSSYVVTSRADADCWAAIHD